MHIISGLYKNRVLKTPKNDTTRPTSAKLRGSIFNILQNQIEDLTFLDLFAGSGSMGIEALSRGAGSATFVEKNKAAAACIRENLSALQIDATVIQADVAIALKRFIKNKARFDIIYIDPPYALAIDPLLEEIEQVLSPDGLIILEQSKKALINTSALKLLDTRSFGDTTVYFFQKI